MNQDRNDHRVGMNATVGDPWVFGISAGFIVLFILLSFYDIDMVGGLDKPEMSTFKWLSIIMCTLLAGGGVFFAAGEPVYHFIVTPPAFDTEAGTAEAVAGALA